MPRAVAVVAAVALLAGCGDGGGGQDARGRTIFDRSCSGCHSLTGRDVGRPGGDLAALRLSRADVASFGRVMPVRLSADEVDAVAAYVVDRARRLRR